jgi:hypothetical protein
MVLLKHLQTGRGISAMAAIDRWEMLRLAARIYDLKQRGIRIERHIVKSVNGRHFASYMMDRA